MVEQFRRRIAGDLLAKRLARDAGLMRMVAVKCARCFFRGRLQRPNRRRVEPATVDSNSQVVRDERIERHLRGGEAQSASANKIDRGQTSRARFVQPQKSWGQV